MSRCDICGRVDGHDLACPFGAGEPVVVGGQTLCVRCRNSGIDRLDGIFADFEPPGPVLCACPAGIAVLGRLATALRGAADALAVAVEAHPGAIVHLRDRLPCDADGRITETWGAALDDLDRTLLPALAAVLRAIDPLVERPVLAVIADPGDRAKRWLALMFDPLLPGRTAGGGRTPEEDDSG